MLLHVHVRARAGHSCSYLISCERPAHAIFVLFIHAQIPFLNAHVDVSSGTRDLEFRLILHLYHSLLMQAAMVLARLCVCADATRIEISCICPYMQFKLYLDIKANVAQINPVGRHILYLVRIFILNAHFVRLQQMVWWERVHMQAHPRIPHN